MRFGWRPSRELLDSRLEDSSALVRAPQWLDLANALVVLGVILRLAQYLLNRSIYRDEAALALNFRWRDWAGMLEPLDFAQTGQVGYLLLLEGLVSLAGDHEYVLRLPSLVFGVGALLLFLKLARHVLSPLGAAIAVGLLALSPAAVYWAADAKQYSVGLLATVMILLLVIRGSSTRSLVALGLLAWFSETAVFVLAGCGLLMIARRERRARVVLPGWAILAGPAVAWSLRARTESTRAYLHDFWQDGFFQYQPMGELIVSIAALPLRAIQYPAGFPFPELVLALWAMGLGVWWLRRSEFVGYLSLPIILTLLAAAFRAYPFGGPGSGGRTILFLLPIAYAFMARGIAGLVARHRTTGVILALLLFAALSPSAGFLPYRQDELRRLFEYAVENAEPGDRVYADLYANHVLEYYRPRWEGTDVEFLLGSCTPGAWPLSRADMPRLAGGRVWIVESLPPEDGHIGEHLAASGRRLDLERGDGGAVTLVITPPGLPPIPVWDRPEGHPFSPDLDCRGFHRWPEWHNRGGSASENVTGPGL